MKREDFEAQVKEFIDFYATEYGVKASYEVEEEDEGEFTATITLVLDEEEPYYVRVGVVAEKGQEPRAVITYGEDSYSDMDTATLYAHLWLETVSRLRRQRKDHQCHHVEAQP